MNLGIGSKLFLTSVGIIVVVEATAAIVLRSEVRETLHEVTAHELERHAESAKVGLETMPDLDGPKGQALAKQIALATSTEVEIFDAEGNVLADTDPGGFGDVLSLPEVRAALDPEQRGGRAYRGGRVLVARPFRYGDGLGVVRLAATRKVLDRAYDRLWVLLTIGAGIGLVVAMAMTFTATALIRRSLRRLATSAAQVAAGGARRIAFEPQGEMGEVGDFINRMADDAERTVRALVHERALLGSVLDGMSQGVIALDGDRRMTLVNPAARDMLALPLPVGEAFIDHVRIPAVVSLVESAPVAGEAELTTPAGTRIAARVHPQRDGAGCILVLEDVTDLRRLETIRRDFVANVSHELRTPVSVIRANAETLQAGAKDDPAFAGRLVDGLHRNAERLARIIADLLDLSRLEAGQYRIERTPIDVLPAAQQAVAALERNAAAKQVTVQVDVGEDVRVTADGKALDQILVNLIDNAIKYTAPAGHVWVRARPLDGRVRVVVADDGPGIAPHHRERIFERFYRVDAGRSREVGGTGLGLAIVKHLVESMGGTVGVDGNEPTGTVFWIELPRATLA
ncbi:MAG: PAS domain-containing sensor histidine kinase [Deltaproteobacteria bacterium]|nr:PAS domain-containing sensor histidine kinase [Kofleriaceae bacterium]